MLLIMDISMQVAREHVAKGEDLLAAAEGQYAGSLGMHGSAAAAMATAHFSAAMAITNILLTDPAEAPEPELR